MDSKKIHLNSYFKLIRDSLCLILLGILILFLLFVIMGCVWFGVNPITFIQAFFLHEDVSVMPDNISNNSSVVLDIGDIWDDETLFVVQAQTIKEISLEDFEAMNDTFNHVAVEDGMRAFQVDIKLENENYTGTDTNAYGYIDGMYAIVHAYGEKSGPLSGNTDGQFGITEKSNAEATAIPKGGEEEISYAFLVPETEKEIRVVVEIPSEDDSKKIYRKEYRYSIP